MVGDILQPTHLLFILLVALVVLGPKRLPEVGRALGKGIRDFRGAMAGIEEQTSGLFTPDPAPTPGGPSAPVQTPAVSTPAAASASPAPLTPAPAITQSAPAVTTPAPAVTQSVSTAPASPAAQTASTARATRVAQTVAAEPDPSEYAD